MDAGKEFGGVELAGRQLEEVILPCGHATLIPERAIASDKPNQ